MLEPATTWSRVEHSTTVTPRSETSCIKTNHTLVVYNLRCKKEIKCLESLAFYLFIGLKLLYTTLACINSCLGFIYNFKSIIMDNLKWNKKFKKNQSFIYFLEYLAICFYF